MIDDTSAWVMVVDARYSSLALLVGMGIPIPPSLAGRDKSSLISLLTSLPIIDGIETLIHNSVLKGLQHFFQVRCSSHEIGPLIANSMDKGCICSMWLSSGYFR